MNAKIRKMNSWRKQLSAAGVDYPRCVSYAQLEKLAKRHLGSAAGAGAAVICQCTDKSERDDQVDDFLMSLSGW